MKAGLAQEAFFCVRGTRTLGVPAPVPVVEVGDNVVEVEGDVVEVLPDVVEVDDEEVDPSVVVEVVLEVDELPVPVVVVVVAPVPELPLAGGVVTCVAGGGSVDDVCDPVAAKVRSLGR